MTLSGPDWVKQFPTTSSIGDLKEPFQTSVRNFLAALSAAGARVVVSDTYRPPQRVYLMHWAFAIANGSANPAKVPPMDGVDIQWVHTDAVGNPDPAATTAAAAAMVKAYGIVFAPALASRHTERLAVDMTISWSGSLTVNNASGSPVTIIAPPTNGMNPGLHAVGATYGVIKLVSDPPHWSSDGH
ncbi:MAG TPA: peptidoglycan-binding domain-containing protein [Candidatus Bathyarchaeia archaeon]|nr:peptidoglycan-binding domain-containing protein [Candidatus Bathyarchaeia archaeon]